MPLLSSVVIRTYTEARWGYLVDAVGSVLAQDPPPAELLIVVDHNPALARRARERWPLPRVVVVENGRSAGSSGAWNCGIEAARGEVVAFLDDDAVAAPGWLAELTRLYDRPEVLGVGGSIVPRWLAGRPGWFPDEFGWVVGCTYRGLPEAVAPVRNLIGCNMSFRREALRAVGAFSEDQGLGHLGGQPVGCDETELCIRLGRRFPGGLLLHNPAAVVEHKVPAARARLGYFLHRCRWEGRSKAIVARLSGPARGLSAERAYTTRTLPAGVARGLADALRGDVSGLGRAAAIGAGLAMTAAAFGAAALGQLVPPRQGRLAERRAR